MKIPLIAGDKIDLGLATDYRDALSVNMYAVEKKILDADGFMLCYPGLTEFGEGSGVDRGAQYNENQSTHFRVSGKKLISVSAHGVVTELGDIPGTSQAAMTYSFNTQAVVADGRMFLYSPLTGFNEVTDANLGNPIDIVWVDGYYFLTDGEFIYHTDLDDETSIDPSKFATAEFMPDPSTGLFLNEDDKVMVLGRYTVEYFDNVAQANFAFRRLKTRAQKIGIVATHAKCESGGRYYFVGGRKDDSLSVYELTLGRSDKISTREIDKILSTYTEPDLVDMRMDCRTENDVTFILIHLPDKTFCFNKTIAKTFGRGVAWTILKTGVTGVANYRAINGIFDARNTTWIYGDKGSSNIGTLDNNVFTQYDGIQEWELFTPFLDLEGFSIERVDLETIPGHMKVVVDEDEDEAEAKVFVSITYNGITYGTEESILYGEPQEYDERFIVRRLGYVDDWAGLKFRGATKSRMAFANMDLQYG